MHLFKTRISSLEFFTLLSLIIRWFCQCLATENSTGVVDLSAVNSSRSCLADQYTNGCSVPLGIAAPYKSKFTPACNKHDICYGCGHHFNWTRDLCDDGFLADMKTTCKHLYGRHHVHRQKRFLSALLEVWYFFQGISKEERRCNLFADMYYKVVRTFGKPHFEIRDHDYCWSTCADQHGSPYEDLPKVSLF